ncbi:MAG: hypothetical protein ACO3A4_10550 [Silvanigrellaceae bacterium]
MMSLKNKLQVATGFVAVLGIAGGLLLVACGKDEDEGSEFMSPGENCLSCHGSGGKAAKEAQFTLAGTVFSAATSSTDQGLEGVKIDITDSAGKAISLTSNRVGNFFTSQAISYPLKTVKVSKNGKEASMGTQVSSGGCASCHAQPAAGGAPGRLYLSL